MKYSLLAVLSGVLISVMIAINGELTYAVGNYRATLIIHAVGLTAILLALLASRKRLHPGPRLPIYMYFGGVVGVLSVMFNNFSYAALGVSITLALGLLGQMIISFVIDRFGLFGAKAQRFRKDRLLSALLVLVGIVVMMIG